MTSLCQDVGLVGRCLERPAGALRCGPAFHYGEAGSAGSEVLSPGLDRPLVHQEVGGLDGVVYSVPHVPGFARQTITGGCPMLSIALNAATKRACRLSQTACCAIAQLVTFECS